MSASLPDRRPPRRPLLDIRVSVRFTRRDLAYAVGIVAPAVALVASR